MKQLTIVSIFCCLVIISCKKDEEDDSTQMQVTYDDTPYVLDIGPFPEPVIPADNQLTVQKVELGRMLFYEPRLSALENQSCASCHKQENAFTDTARFSSGTFGDLGDRQAMSAFNLAWNTNGFLWDGRSPSLRHQSLQPIQNPVEMAETHNNVIAKLNQDVTYRNQFIRAFGDDEITAERMGLAMEQFMTTIVSNDSKYDRVQAGIETYTESEQRGHDLFFMEYNPFFPDQSGADCAHCHSGVNFENDQYMNNGLDTDVEFTDLGLFNVTENDLDKAKFKVTTLRNIELTPPYMHDGRFQTLEEVLDHYNQGVQLSSTVDPTIANTEATGLFLTEEDKQDLVNFLKTLTDETLMAEPAFSDPF